MAQTFIIKITMLVFGLNYFSDLNAHKHPLTLQVETTAKLRVTPVLSPVKSGSKALSS